MRLISEQIEQIPDKEENKKKKNIIYWLPIVFLPLLLSSILGEIFNNDLWWWDYFLYAVGAWLNLILLYIVLKKNDLNFTHLGFKNFKLNDIGWAALFFGIGILLYQIVTGLLYILGIQLWELRYTFRNPIELIIMIFSVVITAPLSEEILFRGFTITELEERLSNKLWIVALISMFLFGLHHLFPFNIGAFILMFCWATLPTILYIWKKSIYPGLAMHIINNIFAWIMLALIFPGYF